MSNFFNKLSNVSIFFILFFTVTLLHADIIFAPSNCYFSFLDLKDLIYFLNIRQYTVHSILSGIFPLWTTKVFCGIPFFANSETATFYLPNIIFYILPLSKAFNLSFILHFVLMSFGMFLWINNKIKDKLICICIALVCIFFSPFYLHACAAHLSNTTTIAWFPFLLYLYDKVYEKKNLYFVFPITFIISLQIFAGHFQYVYYSALFSLIYIILFCRNKYAIITIFVSYFISLFLTAIQFLPSLDFYFEGARRFGALSHFSLFSKFIYLITAVFPETICDINNWFWETSNYIGVLSLFIIFLSVCYIHNKDIMKYVLIAVIIYLFSFEYFAKLANYFIPFFSSFRSPVKMNFFAGFFLFPILAYGIKYIFSKDTKINKYFILILLMLSLIVFLFRNIIINFVTNITNKNNDYLELSIIKFSVIALIFAGLLYFRKYNLSKIIIVILLVIEPFLVMRFYSKPFLLNNDYKYEYTLRQNFNEQVRFFSNDYYNLKYKAENLSGSVPDALYNYWHFMEYLKNTFNEQNIWGLLRCEYIIDEKNRTVNKNNINPLKRLNVFYDYEFETNKEKIYEILSKEKFNIFNTVILEKEPENKPKNKGEYKIDITYFDENSIEFNCYTTEPAIVLYTDNYSKGWTAYNIENPKEKYDVICADYIYKAISLQAGKHKIRIEYKPLSFTIGFWISFVSWMIFILSFLFFLYSTKINYKTT